MSVKKYQYDAMGNVVSITDALGNTSSSTYNLAGMIETETNAETAARSCAFTVQYSYNGLGQKIKETRQGATYAYQYDGMGNLLRTEIDGVMKSSSTYDLAGRETATTDALGNTTTKRWNYHDKLSKTATQGDATIGSLQTIYQYDKLGNLVYSKDSMGAINTYTYDSLGRNLSQSIMNVSGDSKIITSTSYDLNGNVLSKTDGNNNTTNYTYDALNRNLTVKNALNQVTTYTYDKNGNLISQVDRLGNVTKNVYDGINRLVETRDAYDHVIKQLEYNDADAQTASYDALHNKTAYLYDKNLRQVGTIDAEGNTSSMVYDLRGNIIEKKDGKGNKTSYQYDGENHLTKVTDALGNNTAYTYDAAGNMLTQTDGNGNTTTYHHNSTNLLTSKVDPSGAAESYTYYANGKMKEKTDRNGVLTSYVYDVFGRLLSENAGGQLQSYTYDANGNMLTMTDGTGTTTRTYDALNRNTSKDVPVVGKSIYQYDLVATLQGEYSERTTDPKGNITLKTYDKVGRLSKVTVEGRTTEYSYYNNGNRRSVKYPDGTIEAYDYDGANRVITLINTSGKGSIISTYNYTYDAAGNQKSKQDSNGITYYDYDMDNRLSQVEEPGGKVTFYTYDAAGNRMSEEVKYGLVVSKTVYSYDNCGRLVTTGTLDDTVIKYQYDGNGNLVSKSIETINTSKTNDQSQNTLPEFDMIISRGDEGTGTELLEIYGYDNYNCLIKLKVGDKTTTYAYNAQGYRVEKKTKNKTTRYLYEYDKVVLETDGSNNQTAFMVYGTNLLYRSAEEAGSGTQSYYYLYNAHGDVTSLLDMEGNIVVSYDYDAFGNIKGQNGTADNPIRYAGYQYDEESGLYYLNARYYDSVTARFLTEDTYTGKKNDPLSLNLYTYCSNNPIKYTDPSGHWTSAVHVTLTKKIAKEEFSTYLEKQVKDEVVYKKNKDGSYKEDKNGFKVIDEKKSEKEAVTWLKEQRQKAVSYASALAAGDEYIDQENTIFQRTGFSSDCLFHGRKDANPLNDVNNPQVFINERKSTASAMITSNTYSKKGAITTYIVNPALTILDNYTGAYSSSLTKIKSDIEDKIVEKKVGKKVIKTTVNVFKDDSAYDSAYKYIASSSATQETAAVFICGMGLHTLQDTYSHGNITKDEQHIENNDDTTVDSWSYDKEGNIVTIKGNVRITNTENDTRDYIDTILYGDGTENNTGYGDLLFTPYSSIKKDNK